MVAHEYMGGAEYRAMVRERDALQQEVELRDTVIELIANVVKPQDGEAISDAVLRVVDGTQEQNTHLSAALAAMVEAAKRAIPDLEMYCQIMRMPEHVSSLAGIRKATADPTTTAAYAAARQAQDVVRRVRDEKVLRPIIRSQWGYVEGMGHVDSDVAFVQRALLNGPDGEQAGEGGEDAND